MDDQRLLLRIGLLLIAGIVGVWAGGLSNPLMSLVVVAIATGIFALNSISLFREFRARAEAGRARLRSGEASPWNPAGLVVFYLGVALMAVGAWMLLTVFQPHGQTIDAPAFLKYGALAFVGGILLILVGRYVGRGKL